MYTQSIDIKQYRHAIFFTLPMDLFEFTSPGDEVSIETIACNLDETVAHVDCVEVVADETCSVTSAMATAVSYCGNLYFFEYFNYTELTLCCLDQSGHKSVLFSNLVHFPDNSATVCGGHIMDDVVWLEYKHPRCFAQISLKDGVITWHHNVLKDAKFDFWNGCITNRKSDVELVLRKITTMETMTLKTLPDENCLDCNGWSLTDRSLLLPGWPLKRITIQRAFSYHMVFVRRERLLWIHQARDFNVAHYIYFVLVDYTGRVVAKYKHTPMGLLQGCSLNGSKLTTTWADHIKNEYFRSIITLDLSM
jgi:hypothetical protein